MSDPSRLQRHDAATDDPRDADPLDVDPLDALDANPTHGDAAAPGGPYFGRLLIVLFAAVAFCALMTWYLSTSTTP